MLGGGERTRLDADLSVSEVNGLLVRSDDSPSFVLSRESPTLALNLPSRLRRSDSAPWMALVVVLLLLLLLTSASRLRGWLAGSLTNCCRSDGELRLVWCQLPMELKLRSALGLVAPSGGDDASPRPMCSLLRFDGGTIQLSRLFFLCSARDVSSGWSRSE